MQLPTTIEECHRLILKQAQIIEELMVRVGEMERRLEQDSHNSHKPRSKGGKRGGQA